MITVYTDLLYDFDKVLIGDYVTMPDYHFKSIKTGGNGENNEFQKKTNQKTVITLCRHVFEDIMHWTPNEALELGSVEFQKTMCLRDLVNKYVIFNKGDDEKAKWTYVCSLCYPSKITYSHENNIIAEFERVMGKMGAAWRRNFFSVAENGRENAAICLRYCVEKYFLNYSIENLYDTFANTGHALEILSNYKLKKACTELFADPLDYLHTSLPPDKKNEFLNSYERFNLEYQKRQSNPKQGNML